MYRILIVDDEPDMLYSMQKILSRRKDLNLVLEPDALIAKKTVENKKFDLIITDLKMPGASGFDILETAKRKCPDSLVIIISGYGTIEASVDAMRAGAFDFIEKPFTSKKLLRCIDRALQNVTDSPEEEEKHGNEDGLDGIIFKSKLFAEALNLAKKVAPGNMNVLITGESGTGKELIARAIHRLSKRNLNPFVPVNCGALPEHLFESELFGHERGAFTGAVKTKPGLLEFANHGTFFFDEIGDMSPTLQVKMLRMLEDHKIRHVGGQQEIEIDVRVIAATNRNLEKMVQEDQFREDLYYRLNTILTDIPPLRNRKEDILPLANHFLKQLCEKNGRDRSYFSQDAQQLLMEYSWPGNARELQNIISRGFYLSSGDVIDAKDLPMPRTSGSVTITGDMLQLEYKQAKESVLERFEVEYLTFHLRNNKGNISRTAEACGLDRRSIHRLVNKYYIIYRK